MLINIRLIIRMKNSLNTVIISSPKVSSGIKLYEYDKNEFYS